MNISSYIDAMSEKKFALSMPEGPGLLTYLEKGEKGLAVGRKTPARDVHELRVEENKLIVPPKLEKRLGLTPGASLEVIADRGRVEILPNIHSLNRLYLEPTSRCNLPCRTCVHNIWD